jgi:Flp pilus assembly protein CpaB
VSVGSHGLAWGVKVHDDTLALFIDVNIRRSDVIVAVRAIIYMQGMHIEKPIRPLHMIGNGQTNIFAFVMRKVAIKVSKVLSSRNKPRWCTNHRRAIDV